MTYHFDFPAELTGKGTETAPAYIQIYPIGATFIGLLPMQICNEMPREIKEASQAARAAWVQGRTGIPYTIQHPEYKGFEITEAAGKLVGYRDKQTAVGYSIRELKRVIDAMTEPDGPDPADEARDYQNYHDWADQPTPYDP